MLSLLEPAACTGIANSNNVSLTCSSATDSQANPGFQCDTGYYLVNNTAPTADACVSCTGIANSNNVSITCASATDSQANSGFQCDAGYYLINNAASTADACAACATIPNSNNVNVRCTTAQNSEGYPNEGFKCNDGFRRVWSEGAVIACTPCPGIENSNGAALYCEDKGVCDR
jgi:subtilase family serine protease